MGVIIGGGPPFFDGIGSLNSHYQFTARLTGEKRKILEEWGVGRERLQTGEAGHDRGGRTAPGFE